MLQIFNSGIGYIMVVKKNVTKDVVHRLGALKQDAWIIGEIVERTAMRNKFRSTLHNHARKAASAAFFSPRTWLRHQRPIPYHGSRV